MEKIKYIPKILFAVIYIGIVFLLLKSMFIFGYKFSFNVDELYHLQMVYFISRNLKPYVDFYTVYTPILHWFLLPLYAVTGFSLTSIYYGKGVMIILYVLRLITGFLLTKRIFNIRVALLFLILIICEPFTVVAGMQIRPDNLALLIILIALLHLSYIVDHKQNRYILINGFIFGLALFTTIKMAPVIAAVFISLFIYTVLHRRIITFIFFINGFLLSFFLFFVYFALNGSLFLLIQQTFIDPFTLFKTVNAPTPFYYFYTAESSLMYNDLGKPIAWIISMLLPLISFAGSYSIFQKTIKNKFQDRNHVLRFIIALSCIFLFVSMFFITSVWIQYYLPLTFMYTMLTAYLIDEIYTNHDLPVLVRKLFLTIIIIILIFLIKATYQGNVLRSYNNISWQLPPQQELWKEIGENERTFSNVLFRLPVYPDIYPGMLSTVPQFMTKRYGPIYKYIEKYNVSRLFIDDAFFKTSIDQKTQEYIQNNFKKDPQNPLIWRRISRNNIRK